jgi:6-phosphogluconolactonase
MTGQVSLCGYLFQRNPSYLCITGDNKYLFAVEELPEGNGARVFSYEICSDYGLKPIESKEISGGYACHLAICAGQLVITNYMSGDAMSFKILKGGRLSDHQQKIQNYGSGPDKLRQESPHMHMVYPIDKKRIFFVDLSLDHAQGYVFESKLGEWIKEENLCLKVEAGSGARHMVMSDDKSFAFVLGELTGEIFVFKKGDQRFKIIQKISFMNDNKLIPSGAAIKIHPNGNYLYTSDRTSNNISVFKINKKLAKLTLVAHIDSEGKSPRDFSFDPDGNWLIVANQDSNNLVVFRVDKESGLLVKNSTFDVNTPVNVCFQYSV